MQMIWKSSDVELDDVNTRSYFVKPRNRVIVPTAEQETEHLPIKGRDSPLTKKYGYKNIPLPIDFYIFENTNFKNIFRKAKVFFIQAKTLKLVEDDVYYKIKSVSFEDAVNPIINIGEFTVDFLLDPFQYEVDNEPINIRKETTIINGGHDSLPIITVSAFGTGKVYINNQVVTIKDVNGNIIIDSEMKNAYREGSPPINMNKHMIGGFPVLEHGNNIVSFSGSINWIEIICNRRWL